MTIEESDFGSESGRTRVSGIERVKNGFLFRRIPVAPGVYRDCVFLDGLLDGGVEMPQAEHWRRGRGGNVMLPNGLMQYSMDIRAFELRDDVTKIVNEYRDVRRRDLTSSIPHTGGVFRYEQNSIEAAIEHLQPGGNVLSVFADIPEFERFNEYWSYLVLAREQSPSELGEVEIIPENARPFLQGTLGDGYEVAGAVYQSILPLNSRGNLFEVRAWTPTRTNRKSKRALVLGVDDDSSRFSIVASGSIIGDRPARGVAVVGEKS